MLSITNNLRAQIIPLFQHPKAKFNREKGTIEIKEFKLLEDGTEKIFQNDSLIFIPFGEYEFCTVEIFKQFLIFTKRSKEQNQLAYLYILPKNEIKIYNLITKKWFEADLLGTIFKSINERDRCVIVSDALDQTIKRPYYELN